MITLDYGRERLESSEQLNNQEEEILSSKIHLVGSDDRLYVLIEPPTTKIPSKEKTKLVRNILYFPFQMKQLHQVLGTIYYEKAEQHDPA